MEKININQILNREEIEKNIESFLHNFELNRNNKSIKNGIYLYGQPGCGKSYFISKLLEKMDYDIIKFDAGDIRNTSIIDDITKHNMSNKNVISMFTKKTKKIAIVMDEIDGMNNGDKGGINMLIKLIRPKKTKKQLQENFSLNPIICISNYKMDKKIKELMKVCNSFELKCPTPKQMNILVEKLIPSLDKNHFNKVIGFTQFDLRKLNSLISIYNGNNCEKLVDYIDNCFHKKSYNDDTKKLTSLLLEKKFSFDEHSLINETDRTSIGLLWHENIIDLIQKLPKKNQIVFYLKQLENICFADYIDRITFQNQIWQFNEMSSLIKTLNNNNLFHDYKEQFPSYKYTNKSEIRFTKVLTKYSTEYNNSLFIQRLCQKLGLDKSDLIGYFNDLKYLHEEKDIYTQMEFFDINKLEINRIFRYIEKYTNIDALGTNDLLIDEDLDNL